MRTVRGGSRDAVRFLDPVTEVLDAPSDASQVAHEPSVEDFSRLFWWSRGNGRGLTSTAWISWNACCKRRPHRRRGGSWAPVPMRMMYAHYVEVPCYGLLPRQPQPVRGGMLRRPIPNGCERGGSYGSNGPRGPPADGGAPGINKTAACTNCHNSGGGGSDVEHTPMQTGGYSDDDLINIFANGKKPAGVEQRLMPADRWSKIHPWEMSAEEKKGIIVYLRSLTPKSQGALDFGGPRGGGGGGRRDGGAPGGGAGGGTGGGTGNRDGGSVN